MSATEAGSLMSEYRIGIDLGGTKIAGILLDAEGRTLDYQRLPTPQNDYPATLAAIVTLVKNLEVALAQPARVGIGTPGAVSRLTGRMKNANSTCLIGQPLAADLSQRLQRPVQLANDADCFTLSEATDGAAQGAQSVFGVILGTGVGGGIVLAGQPVSGPNAIAGEWGHNPLPWLMAEDQPLPSCYCGKQGCIEAYLSGPGLAADYLRHTQQSKTAQAIAQAAQQGEPQANACLVRYCRRLAKGLASVINILDPEVIVLGGGVSNIQVLYQRVPEYWTEYVFSDRVDTRLCQAQHGDDSGVRGAAWL